MGKSRWILNILTVWMLTGLWHGAAWNFVLWGLWFAALLLVEKWIKWEAPAVLCHIYVLLAVCLSFVLFNAESLSQAGSDFCGMFAILDIPAVTGETVYYLRSFGVLFVLGIVGATPLVKRLSLRLGQTPAGKALEPLMMLLLLVLCTAYLVDGSFSPFLYFRF